MSGHVCQGCGGPAYMVVAPWSGQTRARLDALLAGQLGEVGYWCVPCAAAAYEGVTEAVEVHEAHKAEAASGGIYMGHPWFTGPLGQLAWRELDGVPV